MLLVPLQGGQVNSPRLPSSSILCYSQGSLKELDISSLPNFLKNSDNTIWVNLNTSNRNSHALLTDVFQFHPLAVEDCLTGLQYPKVEAYPDYLFLIMQMAVESAKGSCFDVAEVAFFWGKNYLVTVHNSDSKELQQALKGIAGNVAHFDRGVDFLMERVLHCLIEPFRHCVQRIGHRIDELEAHIFEDKQTGNFPHLLKIRKEIVDLRHIVGAEEEIFLRLSRGDFPRICNDCLPYLRDIYDHIYRLALLTDRYRESLTGLLSAHESRLTERTNQVMKLLTILSTVMLPMAIVTGFFGMNFDFLPGLHHPAGWLLVTVGMLFLSGGMLWYFRKKHWL